MMNDQRSKVESSHQWQWGHWDSSFVLPPDWVLNFDFHWIWFWFDRSHRDSSFMLFSLIGSGGATVSGSRGSQGGTAQLGPQPHILARHHSHHHQPRTSPRYHHHHQNNQAKAGKWPARPSGPLTSCLRRSARKWEVMIFCDKQTPAIIIIITTSCYNHHHHHHQVL